jgi:hypothetical protein
MPRPGSHKYDTKRAQTRKRLEDEGTASDKAAGDRARRELREQGMEPRKTGERAEGPKGER